jgi:hypothetical protein
MQTKNCIGLNVHKRTISYCGLCGAEKSSANTVQSPPLPKQSNKHLQTTLIEEAKTTPRYNPALAAILWFWVSNHYLDCRISRPLVAWTGRASAG